MGTICICNKDPTKSVNERTEFRYAGGGKQ